MKKLKLLNFFVFSIFLIGVEAKPAAQDVSKLAAAALPVVGNAPDTTTASFGHWVLRCQRSGSGKDIQRTCEVAQTVQVEGQPGPIAQIAIGNVKKGDSLHLTLLLPTNIEIPKTPRVSINTSDGFDLTWQRCIPGGCFADTVLNDDSVPKLRSASTTGKIEFKDSQGRELSVAISFRGLAQSLDALAKER